VIFKHSAAVHIASDSYDAYCRFLTVLNCRICETFSVIAFHGPHLRKLFKISELPKPGMFSMHLIQNNLDLFVEVFSNAEICCQNCLKVIPDEICC